MASASKKLLVVIRRSTFAGDEARGCTEFRQARYPIKWRKYMCARCGAHRAEHYRGSKAKPAETCREEEEQPHLPPRKRLMLRFQRFQTLATATAAVAAKEQENEEEEEEEGLEEGEIWGADATVTKGKRAPRRKRADAP